MLLKTNHAPNKISRQIFLARKRAALNNKLKTKTKQQ